MSSSNLIRWAAFGALLSGVAWIAAGFLSLTYPAPPSGSSYSLVNYLGTAAISIAYLGVLMGLVGIHLRQSGSYGMMGTIGFLLSFIGAALAFVGQATSAIFPQSGALNWLFNNPGFLFLIALLLFVVGLVILGISTLRAGVMPRWSGFALIGLVVLGFVGAIGWILSGLVWLALGYVLLSGGSAAGQQPSRVV
jgi:hypothetical protein